MFFFLLILRPPTSTLFPYTTLFRSHILGFTGEKELDLNKELGARKNALIFKIKVSTFAPYLEGVDLGGVRIIHDKKRSEEHTSELQSRGHLVCRLLLEKKKKKIKINIFLKKKNNTETKPKYQCD